MNINFNNRSSAIMIGLAIILLTTMVWLIGTSFYQNRQGAQLDESSVIDNGSPSVPITEKELDALTDLVSDFDLGEIPVGNRDLDTYYDRRAYAGSPPIIPHTISDVSFGGNDCLSCHATGDYAPSFEAFTPIVPHPELTACTQCHVAEQTNDLFQETDWETADRPVLGQAALDGSPPPIPHGLQLRGSCVSCHAGPAAPEELRFDHPERTSCEQCHVAIETESDEEWER